MHANYGRALDALFPGANRDKRIARAFGVSVRFAKYLRAGNHWTLYRLAQAAEMFGEAWDAALSKPDTEFHFNLELQDLARRVARVEMYLAQMGDMGTAQMAPHASGADNLAAGGLADAGSRESGQRAAAANEGSAP